MNGSAISSSKDGGKKRPGSWSFRLAWSTRMIYRIAYAHAALLFLWGVIWLSDAFRISLFFLSCSKSIHSKDI
jgi:hypothetical protein